MQNHPNNLYFYKYIWICTLQVNTYPLSIYCSTATKEVCTHIMHFCRELCRTNVQRGAILHSQSTVTLRLIQLYQQKLSFTGIDYFIQKTGLLRKTKNSFTGIAGLILLLL